MPRKTYCHCIEDDCELEHRPAPEPIPGMAALDAETTWDRPLHEHEGEFATDSIVPEHHKRAMLDVLDSKTEQPIWWCADCGHKLPRKE